MGAGDEGNTLSVYKWHLRTADDYIPRTYYIAITIQNAVYHRARIARKSRLRSNKYTVVLRTIFVVSRLISRFGVLRYKNCFYYIKMTISLLS